MSVFDQMRRIFGQAGQNQSTPLSKRGEGEEATEPLIRDEDLDQNISIGVCGEPGSGKTVFFSAVYHTLTYIEGLGRITFDRHTGNPSHLAAVDRELRDTGKATPTTGLNLVRLVPEGEENHGILLFDFRGGQFSDYADPNAAGGSKDDVQVHTYLEKSDAIILLIKSTIFGKVTSVNSDADLNPWVASARKIMDECVRQKKPMALVFTQADRNGTLDLPTIHTFPWVREFDERFRSEKSHQADKPFGKVALLTCYEEDWQTGKPRRRKEGGNTIYLPEPANLFEEMLLAARPSAEARILKAAKVNIELKKGADATRRAALIKKLLLSASPFAAVGLVFLAMLAYRVYGQYTHDRADVETVSTMTSTLLQKKPENLRDRDFAALDGIQTRRGNKDADDALSQLQGAFEDAIAHVAPSVYGGDVQKEATGNLMRLAQYFPIEDEPAFGLLKIHSRLLAPECSNNPEQQPPVAKSAPLSSKTYSDSVFASAVVREANELRASCAQSFADKITQTESELVKIVEILYNQLINDRSVQQDPQWMLAKKRAYEKKMGASLAGTVKAIGVMVQRVRFGKDSGPRTGNNFRQIVEDVRRLDNFGDIRQDIRPSLHDLSQNGPEISRPLKFALGSLFDNVGGEIPDREDLWGSLFDGMESEYYFAVAPDAWPPKQRPLKEYLKAELRKEGYSDEITSSVIDQIAEQPMYRWEAGAIATLLGDLDFKSQCGEAYKTVLEQLGSGASPSLQSVQSIQQIADMASGIYKERKEELGIESPPISRCRDAALNLVQYAGSQISPRFGATAKRSSDRVSVFRQSCGPLLNQVGAPGGQ